MLHCDFPWTSNEPKNFPGEKNRPGAIFRLGEVFFWGGLFLCFWGGWIPLIEVFGGDHFEGFRFAGFEGV